jgi:hypothetical protein
MNVHEFLCELLTKTGPSVKIGACGAPKTDIEVNDRFGGVIRRPPTVIALKYPSVI